MCRTYAFLWMKISPIAAQDSWITISWPTGYKRRRNHRFLRSLSVQLGGTCGLITWHLAPFHCDKHSKSSNLRTYLIYDCQRIFSSSEAAVNCCVNYFHCLYWPNNSLGSCVIPSKYCWSNKLCFTNSSFTHPYQFVVYIHPMTSIFTVHSIRIWQVIRQQKFCVTFGNLSFEKYYGWRIFK